YTDTVVLDSTDHVLYDLRGIFSDAPEPWPSLGSKLAIGETRTIPIGIVTDAASDPVTLAVEEWTADPMNGFAPVAPGQGDLTLSLDVATGQNGQKAYLTISRNQLAA